MKPSGGQHFFIIFLMAVELVMFSISQIGYGKLHFSKNFPSYLNFEVYCTKLCMLCCNLLRIFYITLCHLFLFQKIVICAFSHLFSLVLPKIINLISLFKEPAFSLLILSTSLMFSVPINPASYLNYILCSTYFILF